MELLESLHIIEDQTWLDPTGDQVQKVVTRVLTHENRTGKTLDDLLNGVWLGHPLHPVLTDIPVGAWTVGLVLDALETFTDREDLAPGADAATAIGLVGALGAAVTGLAQWQYTIDRPRRLGLGHALLNVAATTLYGASALLRAGSQRGAGKATALVGYGIAVVASYIGGDLVFGERLGVTHVPEQQPPDTFTPALPDAELPEGKMTRVMVGDTPVLLVRQAGKIYALGAVCSHLGGPLEEGTLGDCDVTCPWHASRFALDDGRMLNGPATFPQPTYETRVRNGQIEVRARPLQ